MNQAELSMKNLFDDIKKVEVYQDLLESRVCCENGEYEDFDGALDDITKKYCWDEATIPDISEMMQKQLEKKYYGMYARELYEKLRNIPDSYPAFVAGIMRYATTGKDKTNQLMEFIHSNPNAKSSDIVFYTMKQPNFHDIAKQTKLERCLYGISDVYPDFIKAVMNYVSRKIGRVDIVQKYIDENQSAETADVLDFISNQKDFYEDGE